MITEVLLTVHCQPEQIYKRKEISTTHNMETVWPRSPSTYRQKCGNFAFKCLEIHCVPLRLNMANSLSNR
jgi:hypothetical protein